MARLLASDDPRNWQARDAENRRLITEALKPLEMMHPDDIAAFLFEQGIFDTGGTEWSIDSLMISRTCPLANYIESVIGEPVLVSGLGSITPMGTGLRVSVSGNLRTFISYHDRGDYDFLQFDHPWNEDLVGDLEEEDVA